CAPADSPWVETHGEVGMIGRPTTSPELIRLRQSAWKRAVKFSGLSQEEIADVIGMSLATVRSYGSRSGNTPTEDAIGALKKHNLLKAMETLAERYGPDTVSGGPQP